MKLLPVAVTVSALAVAACSGTIVEGDGGIDSGADAGRLDGGNPPDAGTRCTPGNFVFCRCADRSEGTKECLPDGRSFAPCTTGAGRCSGE